MTETFDAGVVVTPGAVAADAVVVAGYALLAGGALLAGAVDGAWRVLLAAPLVGVLPGYALLSALVPAADDGDGRTLTAERLRRPGLAWAERCSLSVAVSVAALPILALGLSALGVPLAAGPVTAALVVVVVVAAGVGVGRRLRLPSDRRYAPPLGGWLREARAAFDRDRGVDAGLNLLLAVAVVAAMAGLAYGLAAPPSGEAYTEAALLTGEDGELVAGNYTSTATRGEPVNVTLSVENREGRTMEYAVVVVLERLRPAGNGSDPAVVERNELARTNLTVPDGDRRTRALSAEPETLGDDLRLSVLLFEGGTPATATPADADEHLYLWIDVEEGGTASLEPPTGSA